MGKDALSLTLSTPVGTPLGKKKKFAATDTVHPSGDPFGEEIRWP